METASASFWEIQNIKDAVEIVSFFATIIAGIGILFALRDYSINRKQLNLSALESCITRFRDNFLHLNKDSKEEEVTAYIDLINEELFYFEQRFLPRAVAMEWIDGMIDHVPLYDPYGNLLNPGISLPIIHNRKILDQYRFKRVKKAFTLKSKIDADAAFGDVAHAKKEKAREKIVKEIISNLDIK
ncbi:MAG: hypothetical protein AAF587_15880 [Bacteroidota bacterium]